MEIEKEEVFSTLSPLSSDPLAFLCASVSLAKRVVKTYFTGPITV